MTHSFARGEDSDDDLDGFCPGADYCEVLEEPGECPDVAEY